jgi:hypothetical protein
MRGMERQHDAQRAEVADGKIVEPTGVRVTLNGITVAKFSGERICSLRQYWDELQEETIFAFICSNSASEIAPCFFRSARRASSSTGLGEDPATLRI